MGETPFSQGYRMPAEWEPHEGTWIAWPKNPETFISEHLRAVKKTFATMVEELCKGENVHLMVDDSSAQREVLSVVRPTPNLTFHKIKSADVWVRDYGPIFVKSSEVAGTKWVFNAWGRKYDDLLPDNETGREILRASGLHGFETDIVLEGGSIDVNGRGFLLSTRQCLLNRNRNPSMNQEELETALADNLGAPNVIWLENGIKGDDTDGHIDDIARFVAHDTVVCMTDNEGENQDSLSADLEILRQARDSEGHSLKVVEIPMPAAVRSDDDLLPASYANFYIGNSVVLVPTFGDPNDRIALRTISNLFPKRKVLGIDCRALVTGLGALHCVTQQQPSDP